jgi:hypothetical protein
VSFLLTHDAIADILGKDYGIIIERKAVGRNVSLLEAGSRRDNIFFLCFNKGTNCKNKTPAFHKRAFCRSRYAFAKSKCLKRSNQTKSSKPIAIPEGMVTRIANTNVIKFLVFK